MTEINCELTEIEKDRYSRQMRFGAIGNPGQTHLKNARILLCGCGALGTVLANTLVRAGVGFIRLVDRDFVELSNLQRQVLFDEDDAAQGVPKSVAGAKKLGQINSLVTIEPVVAHIDRGNILELAQDVDLILDGTDNFEIRYLINDAAIKLGIPWVYGGCIGSHGQFMTILPGDTPCLRCVFEAAPGPGEAGTCDTAGVLGMTINLIASFQATEAIKILTGNLEAINRDLVYLDCWENSFKKIKIARLKGKVDCPCCTHNRFEWLDGELGAQTTSLCGRNAVQIAHAKPIKLDFEFLTKNLIHLGNVSSTRFLLRFSAEDCDFTVFPDGRAIIKGTDEPDRAMALYARYIGH
ncbi:MAG: ThiF family adenylyltransferase [Planctomycetota bacterium]|nr:ThiF family adenylyltransferase [Planctomycetota bacterium]